MNKTILATFLLISSVAFGQVPEDLVKYSFLPQNGTARNLAIGGAMGSLGGDITATFVNPAGLGNFRTGEFVFTPGFFLNNNRGDFRDTRLDGTKKNNFTIGNIGLVFGASNRYEPTTSQAMSIVVAQTANFNNSYRYRGNNNYSSFSEQWSESVFNRLANGDSIPGILGNPSFGYGASPALFTYLTDTFPAGNGNYTVKSMPEFVLESGKALLQENSIETRGSIYEIALGYAYNKKDKLLIGGSLGIPILNYDYTSTFRESDTSADANNNFDYFNYKYHYKTTGVGMNLKLGIIYKPEEYIRLGLAIHTPTYMFTMKDRINSSLESSTEGYNGLASVSSDQFTNGQPGESKYTMLTPWKVMISGSYVFREVENVKKQKAFITADIEYVRYRSGGFYSANEDPADDEINYFKDLTTVVRNQYKGNFNFRVGGELKFNIIMARLGFAYYMNPYKDAALKANRMLLSGGLGYRHKGFFIDLTYVHSISKDVDFAYRLQDKNNTFATLNNQRGNIVATVGLKF